jgi:hypothetical protein
MNDATEQAEIYAMIYRVAIDAESDEIITQTRRVTDERPESDVTTRVDPASPGGGEVIVAESAVSLEHAIGAARSRAAHLRSRRKLFSRVQGI